MNHRKFLQLVQSGKAKNVVAARYALLKHAKLTWTLAVNGEALRSMQGTPRFFVKLDRVFEYLLKAGINSFVVSMHAAEIIEEKTPPRRGAKQKQPSLF